MAESIYTQLEKGRAITPVNGKDYETPLPEELFPTSEEFESEEKLIEWATECGYTAKLIQKGLQKAIIEVRAAFKSCPKDEEWTEEMGIANVNALEWKSVNRPGQTSSKKLDEARFKDCMAMIAQLTASNIPAEQIRSMTTPIYGEEIVEAIFTSLTA